MTTSPTAGRAPMPNHMMDSGTQAVTGIGRNHCTMGSNSPRQKVDQPVSTPRLKPASEPMAKPSSTRCALAPACSSQVPEYTSALRSMPKIQSAPTLATPVRDGNREEDKSWLRATNSQIAATIKGTMSAFSTRRTREKSNPPEGGVPEGFSSAGAVGWLPVLKCLSPKSKPLFADTAIELCFFEFNLQRTPSPCNTQDSHGSLKIETLHATLTRPRALRILDALNKCVLQSTWPTR